MKNITLKAWDFGLALIDGYEEIMSAKEIEENKTYDYIVGENMFEELKECFLEFLMKTNYKPIEVDFEEMARQIAVHYVACIENEPTEEYIKEVISFNSVKESAKWFWDEIMEELEEYDAEV